MASSGPVAGVGSPIHAWIHYATWTIDVAESISLGVAPDCSSWSFTVESCWRISVESVCCVITIIGTNVVSD